MQHNRRIEMDKRTEANLRAVIDEIETVCDEIRNSYPERYPVPPEIDAVLNMESRIKKMVRSELIAA